MSLGPFKFQIITNPGGTGVSQIPVPLKMVAWKHEKGLARVNMFGTTRHRSAPNVRFTTAADKYNSPFLFLSNWKCVFQRTGEQGGPNIHIQWTNYVKFRDPTPFNYSSHYNVEFHYARFERVPLYSFTVERRDTLVEKLGFTTLQRKKLFQTISSRVFKSYWRDI